ncbi:TRAP transporter small permease [Ruegeria pomeroyi]|nr:TRAP transporter small permease [Ruegeria pomeroyi]
MAATLFVFASVLSRYLFNSPFRDDHDISRLLLGAGVSWGIGAALHRGGLVQMDLLFIRPGRPTTRIADGLGRGVRLVALVALTIALCIKTLEVAEKGETTFDLSLPLWWFYGIASAGPVAALLLFLRDLFGKAPSYD